MQSVRSGIKGGVCLCAVYAPTFTIVSLLLAAAHIAVGTLGASPGQMTFIAADALGLGLFAGDLRWLAHRLVPGRVVRAQFNVLAS